jgi:hypothetical protein
VGASVKNPSTVAANNPHGVIACVNVSSIVVLFAPAIIGTYTINLTPSVDTGAGPGAGTIPTVGYDSTVLLPGQFTAVFTGPFTGSLGWEVIPP